MTRARPTTTKPVTPVSPAVAVDGCGPVGFAGAQSEDVEDAGSEAVESVPAYVGAAPESPAASDAPTASPAFDASSPAAACPASAEVPASVGVPLVVGVPVSDAVGQLVALVVADVATVLAAVSEAGAEAD